MPKKKKVTPARPVEVAVSATPAPSRPAAKSEAPAKPVVKRAPKAAAKAGEKASAKDVVVIDYPLEGEIVRSAYYSFRIGTTATEGIEVSINGKDWHGCRPSAGYWWFDWSGYAAGPYRIEARIPSGKRYAKSGTRSFTVLI